MLSAKYGGAWPDKDEKMKHASLKSTRLVGGVQPKLPCGYKGSGLSSKDAHDKVESRGRLTKVSAENSL